MSTILTRQQLYDRAWTTPIYTLARKLGLSGRGLGKLCARHDIPVPPRGYWAKKAFGKRVVKPPLPSPDTYGQRISFNAPSRSEAADTAKEEVHPLIAFEAVAANRIIVPEDLPLSDPLVLATQKRLLHTKREPSDLIALPDRGLSVHTSRTLHDRALRIMQALLPAFAARGFAVAMTNEGARVTVLDELLGFAVVEDIKQVEHRISFTEQKLIDRGAGSQVPKSDSVPAGTLALVITNVGQVRQRWSESPGKPLESLLNKFLVGLVRAAFGLKKQRADAERREQERLEQERKRREEARRQAELERRWRDEQGKVQRLEQFAAVWRRNRELRQIALEARVALGEFEAGSELARWLDWIDGHVAGSDPMRHLRKQQARKLTVFYHGWDHSRVAESGFTEPSASSYPKQQHAFMGLLTCAHCGCAITAERKKGKYVYYHCTDHHGGCENTYIREENLSSLLADVIKAIQITPEIAEAIADAISASENAAERTRSEAPSDSSINAAAPS